MKKLIYLLRWWLNTRVIKKIYRNSVEGIIILNSEAVVTWANSRVTKEMPDIKGKNLTSVIGSEFTWPPITNRPVRRKLDSGVIEYTVTPIYHHYLVNIRFLDGNDGIIPEMEEVAKRNINQLVHDIKSHINGIIGFAGLSYENLHEDPEEAKKFLKESIRIANDMAQSVDSHLLVSKLEKGGSNLILKSTTGLKEVADEAAELILASFSRFYEQGHNIEIINSIPEDLNVCVDKTMLKNALINGLKNAVEAEKKVRIEARQNGKFVEIRIINPGSITPENLQRIFHETDTFSTKNGNGLGTRAIKLITEAHGGQVSIACENNQVTLTLTLPKE